MTSEEQMAVERLTLLADGCDVEGLDHLPVAARANAKSFAADLRALLASLAKLEERAAQLEDAYAIMRGQAEAAEARLAALSQAAPVLTGFPKTTKPRTDVREFVAALQLPPSEGDGPKNLCGSPSASRGTGEGAATPSGGRQCEPMRPDEEGWSEWIHPLPGYLMQCCDCGLIHEMEHAIGERVGDGPLNEGESEERVVLFRARRWEGEAARKLPDDVGRLVVAARIVAHEDQGLEAMRELDAASEAFASRVPWDDEPEDGSQTQPDGPREGGSIAAEPQQNTTLPSEGEREKIARLDADWFDEVEDFLDDYSDAEIIDGTTHPNKAMRLLCQLRDGR